MPSRSRVVPTFLVALGLLAAGCGESGQTTSSDAPTNDGTTLPTSDETSPTTATPTSAVTTTTVDPTIFDPNRVGDILELSSFVLTIDVVQTFDGNATEHTDTIGYVKDPFTTSWSRDFDGDGSIDGSEYSIDGRYYEAASDWYLYESGSPETPYGILYPLSTLILAQQAVSTANFVGEEEIGGVAAYHFTFDDTDLAYYDPSVPADPANTLEGHFYLAQAGNYVLYAYSKQVNSSEGSESAYEVTETLSSINQLAEISGPADFVPMSEALNIGAEFAELLPPGSSLSKLIRYLSPSGGIGGIGVDYYTYTTPVTTNDEFIQFYSTLPPTNGWTVSHIGHISTHEYKVDCEHTVECVILKNGGDQVVLSFDPVAVDVFGAFAGVRIIAEFDHEHVFGPL